MMIWKCMFSVSSAEHDDLKMCAFSLRCKTWWSENVCLRSLVQNMMTSKCVPSVSSAKHDDLRMYVFSLKCRTWWPQNVCLQSQVQNMMTSKYIAFFQTEVSEWQRKLSTADQVISIYMEVQRTWCHLESIFIGSEDIRSQLPEDSERFDMIDTKFKVWLHFCVDFCSFVLPFKKHWSP